MIYSFSPALCPAILWLGHEKKNKGLSTKLDNLPNDAYDKTDAGNSLFFLTLAFLGLPLFLKSAGVPLQNISKSEAELMGRERQTWDTAGNLTDMLSQSMTQKLEIKFKISFQKKKKKKSSAKVQLNLLALWRQIKLKTSGQKTFLCSYWPCYNWRCNQNKIP